MEKNSKIYVAGHQGLLGSGLVRQLKEKGYANILAKTHQELDLIQQAKVEEFFKKETPEYVVLSAARVGGIKANMSYPAEFIYENIVIGSNLIHAAYKYGVKKLLFLGSACSYPRLCPQPIKEEYLLTGALEPTNEPYALAKIAGLKMCEAYNHQYGTGFIRAILANMYGPGDNFDYQDSHVIPALLKKFHEARIKSLAAVTVWGSGNQQREFIYVDDAAAACIFLLDKREVLPLVNIGTGRGIFIKDLVYIIKNTTGYKGRVIFDTSKPEGVPKKVLSVEKIENFGWRAKISLEEGIKETYQWYCRQNSRS